MKILYLVKTENDQTLHKFMDAHRVSHEVVEIDLGIDKDYGKIVDRIVESDLVISW